jgi:competence protein ComEA
MHRSNSRGRIAWALGCALLYAASAFAATEAGSAKTTGPTSPVDLNQASLEELTAVPGIGPTTAQRIVDWRTEHGPFESVDDLLKIKGIGEKSVEKLRPYVKVSRPKPH